MPAIWDIRISSHLRKGYLSVRENRPTLAHAAEYVLTECSPLSQYAIESGIHREVLKALIADYKRKQDQDFDVMSLERYRPDMKSLFVRDADRKVIRRMKAHRSDDKEWMFDDPKIARVCSLFKNGVVMHGYKDSDSDKTSSVRMRIPIRDWHAKRTLPPISYRELPCFYDDVRSNEAELSAKFHETFGNISTVLYLDSEHCLAFMSLCEFARTVPPKSLDKDYSPVRTIDDDAQEESICHRLVSIKACISIPFNHNNETMTTVYLCELDIPEDSTRVCCVMKLSNDNSKAIEKGKKKPAPWDCVVIRMHNLENIGNLCIYDKLVSKRNSSPLYKDIDIFDPAHAHWYRHVERQKESL
ncbi:hypothetical protein BDK51DRAFT_43441 [Blyttiomyces helicus]|uniref:Uncharacterized protein n=1 Tax=Blyttiomyces helicus TaxID=388810 RepID=A0A4P9WPZ5_9FUNG|nr:hypothetical protein BDK51DRAFT_43441 [Blyttiomyces helicus]|eukprot:RKO94632.1 hypothetical protein BDK51DRAFT_43441 [Blyttiomyces helicus]